MNGRSAEKHSPVNGEHENTSQEKIKRLTVKNIEAKFNKISDNSEIPRVEPLFMIL